MSNSVCRFILFRGVHMGGGGNCNGENGEKW